MSSREFKATRLDLRKHEHVDRIIDSFRPEVVVHFAAESHVCNSITGPRAFMDSNVMGTFNLLEACRRLWSTGPKGIFHHVSTDEVFGQLQLSDIPFDEDSQIQPRSPYAASKAGSDLVAMAYAETYGMRVRVSNCSNNFGPNQHEEKLIPRTVKKLLAAQPVTVYGSGSQVRDWIWVDSHCSAIDRILERGKDGERYCVGGDLELTNLEMIDRIAYAARKVTGIDLELELDFTNDRPTDDLRYAIESEKMKSLGWSPQKELFQDRLERTVEWIIKNDLKAT